MNFIITISEKNANIFIDAAMSGEGYFHLKTCLLLSIFSTVTQCPVLLDIMFLEAGSNPGPLIQIQSH